MFPKSSFKHTAVSQHCYNERSDYEPQLESGTDVNTVCFGHFSF